MKLASILHDGRATVSIVDPDQPVFWTLADVMSGPPRTLCRSIRSSLPGLGRDIRPNDEIPLWPGLGPMSPWIVTADELDVGRLHISCRVNGEPR